MEPAATWGQPWEFQMASWSSVEEPCAHAWGPDGLPPVVEYYTPPTDIFGNTAASFQPYYHTSPSIGQQQQQQLVVYNYDYSAASQTEHGDQNSLAVAEEPSYDNAAIMRCFDELIQSLETGILLTNQKMHRCPPAITRALGELYTVPRVVAIGPYHPDKQHLMAVETVKYLAVYKCIYESPLTGAGMMHDVVFPDANSVHFLYDTDLETAGISSDDKFQRMMLYDACFLLQFIKLTSTDAGGESNSIQQTPYKKYMYNFFKSNKNNILHDIMLLENQIPWQVVQTVMRHMDMKLEVFAAACRDLLQLHGDVQGKPAVDLNSSPHFLGFVWFLLGGRSNHTTEIQLGEKEKIKAVSTSVSATELAEMGINLRANQTAEFGHMSLINKVSVSSRGVFFVDLSMATLSLDDTRASWLVNMAALELCTTPEFSDACCEASMVCSYLRLLCMLVQKEEDVDLLRTEGILQGGAVLTNKEALGLLTSLHSCLGLGCFYGRVMVQIESHKFMWWIQVYAFGYRHWKKFFAIGSAIGAFVGIIKTLMSLKGSHH